MALKASPGGKASGSGNSLSTVLWKVSMSACQAWRFGGMVRWAAPNSDSAARVQAPGSFAKTLPANPDPLPVRTVTAEVSTPQSARWPRTARMKPTG